MRYATAAAFRRALEQRLLATSSETNEPVMRLRKLVTFDRLLARLVVVAPDRWLLKGALALDLRFGARSRTTKDMDLARRDDENAATEDFLQAQSVHLDDFFTFAVQKTAALHAMREGASVRYHAAAELAGRPFDDVIVDVGFGDPVVTTPERLTGRDLLGFAGLEPITIPALPLEQHVAEKVHAYTRIYGDQHRSSRVKDLIDLVLIRSSASFEAARLRHALVATFTRRDTHALPATFPPPPLAWGTAYRRLAREVGLEPDLAAGYRVAAAFLDPLLGETVPEDDRWDPLQGEWSAILSPRDTND